MGTIPYSKIFTVDWRWIGLSFCFFICFHLLPSHIIYMVRIISPAMTTLHAVWMFAGMALVGFLIGYKSQGVTIWEAAIASTVYAFVLLSAINGLWQAKIEFKTPYWIIAIIAIATLSAWFGEYIQAMNGKKSGQRNP
jgi:hypothetical protein